MSDEQNCPIDGCDYQGTADQIKGHMGASTDHPNWNDLDDQVKVDLQSGDGETSDEADDHPSEGASGPGSDPSGDDDPPEQGSEQVEAGQNDQNDHPDDTPSTPAMPDSTDTDDQWTTIQTPEDDPQDQPAEGAEGSDSDLSGGIPLPVSTTTLFMVVGLIAVGTLLYLYVKGGEDAGEDVQETTETIEADVEDVDDLEGDSGEMMGGAGLVATTGGVDDG